MTDAIHEGGCACGAVRFTATGAPIRTGLCHCLNCRKAHSSAANPFLVFRRDQVAIEGDLREWRSSTAWLSKFCPACGSRIVGGDGPEEVELSLGSFDQPGLFEPQYELWVIRREPWLRPLDVPQFTEDRT